MRKMHTDLHSIYLIQETMPYFVAHGPPSEVSFLGSTTRLDSPPLVIAHGK